MPKRSSKSEQAPGEDVNEIAARIVVEATKGDQPELTPDGKNSAAVSLGRLGGKKGGPARAKKLSKERRAEIARKAAKERWNKRAS